MSLLPFFQWLGELSVSVAVRNSVWFYAFDQAAHLIALAVFAGAILMVDLRLMGGGLRQRPLAQVAQDAQPWLIGGLLGLLVTGIPQMMSNSIKEYYSPYFWVKMGILLPAVIFTFTVRRKVALTDEARVGPFWGKVVGLVSIALWLGVAVPARLIGLLS
jgi:putative copper export protein